MLVILVASLFPADAIPAADCRTCNPRGCTRKYLVSSAEAERMLKKIEPALQMLDPLNPGIAYVNDEKDEIDQVVAQDPQPEHPEGKFWWRLFYHDRTVVFTTRRVMIHQLARSYLKDVLLVALRLSSAYDSIATGEYQQALNTIEEMRDAGPLIYSRPSLSPTLTDLNSLHSARGDPDEIITAALRDFRVEVTTKWPFPVPSAESA